MPVTRSLGPKHGQLRSSCLGVYSVISIELREFKHGTASGLHVATPVYNCILASLTRLLSVLCSLQAMTVLLIDESVTGDSISVFG
jgi:hypothetical protein